MARFPYHQRNVKKLGRLLALAATNDQVRQSLEKDPASALSKIGFPQQATELLNFTVIDQKSNPNAIALPFRLNAERLNNSDPAYLANLARSFSLN